MTVGSIDTAIRHLLQEHEAIVDRVNEYGVFYRVEGGLRGPSGILRVITIWMTQGDNELFRFVTLKPAR